MTGDVVKGGRSCAIPAGEPRKRTDAQPHLFCRGSTNRPSSYTPPVEPKFAAHVGSVCGVWGGSPLTSILFTVRGYGRLGHPGERYTPVRHLAQSTVRGARRHLFTKGPLGLEVGFLVGQVNFTCAKGFRKESFFTFRTTSKCLLKA